MKTKFLQLTGLAAAALLTVSCTTAPYYGTSAGYTDYGDKGGAAPYQSYPSHSSPSRSQLHPNAIPLIATGVAALALYGYSKERSARKSYQRNYYGHGYRDYPNYYGHRGRCDY